MLLSMVSTLNPAGILVEEEDWARLPALNRSENNGRSRRRSNRIGKLSLIRADKILSPPAWIGKANGYILQVGNINRNEHTRFCFSCSA
jgi:hypothetical protein